MSCKSYAIADVMKNDPDANVLAIDGGGTHCRIAYGSCENHSLVDMGAANVSSDFEGALNTILGGVEALCAKLQMPVADLIACPCYIGVAGVSGPQMAARLRKALPFSHVQVTDDRPPALRGALGAKDGAIAHCGTGSFWGVQLGGTQKFAGGWGYVLGDEASGHWLGRAALSATLETVDRRRRTTDFSQSLLAQYDGAAGIVRFATHARPDEIAALAPLVCSAAAQDDPLALALMQAGAQEITQSLTDLGWHEGLDLCLTGGLGGQYRPYLPPALQARITAPAAAPIIGALALASDFAREGVA